MSRGSFTLAGIAAAVIQAFPKRSEPEQRVSLALYRPLAQGRPLDAEKLSDASGIGRDAVREMTESFCCHVHFFSSPETAEPWISTHSGTFVLALDEAWQIGVRKNAAQFAALFSESSAK